MVCSLPGSSTHGIQGKNTGVGCHFFLQECTYLVTFKSCIHWIFFWKLLGHLFAKVRLSSLSFKLSFLEYNVVLVSAVQWSESAMCVYLSCYSCVQLFATLWTVSFQAPLSVGFPRQECWSRLPCPPPKNLPDPGIEPESPTVQADSLPSEPLSPHFWTSLQPSPSHPSRSSQSIKLNSLLSPAVAYHLGLRIKKKKQRVRHGAGMEGTLTIV